MSVSLSSLLLSLSLFSFFPFLSSQTPDSARSISNIGTLHSMHHLHDVTNRMLVTTDQTVSCLSYNGVVKWRYVKSSKKEVISGSVFVNQSVVVIFNSGNMVRSFRKEEISWEYVNYDNIDAIDNTDAIGSVNSKKYGYEVLNTHDLLIYNSNTLKLLHYKTGEVEWKLDISIIHMWYNKIIYSIDKLYIYNIDINNGSIISKILFNMTDMNNSILLSNGIIIWQNNNILNYYSFSNKKSGTIELPKSGKIEYIESKIKPYFILHGSSNVYLMKLSNEFELKMVSSASSDCVFSISKTGEYSSTCLLSNNLQLMLQNGTTYSSPLNSNYLKIKKSFYDIYHGKSTTQHRVLVSLNDDSIVLLSNNRIKFTREEGLASIQDAQFANLHTIAEDEEFPTFFPRLKMQLEIFSNFISSSINSLKLFLNSLVNKSAHHAITNASNSLFGFKQNLLIISKFGKFYNLESDTGIILWSVLLPFINRDEYIYQFYQVHSVYAVIASIPGKNSIFFTISHYGVLLSTIQLQYSIIDCILFHSLFAIDGKGSVHDLFASSSKEMLANFHYYQADRSSGAITGYIIKDMKLNELWRHNYEDVLEIVALHDKSVNSEMRFSGTKSHRKYLNPNMIAIATKSNARSEFGVMIHILDTISGNIIAQMFQPGLIAPIKMVFVENFVIVHGYSPKTIQYEIAVLELLGEQHNFSFLEGLLGIQREIVSSWNATNPTINRASYIYYSAVSTIGVTMTNQGITNRQILLGMPDGQIQGLDLNFFDPNRVPQPLPEDKEEGLIPYNAVLPRNNLDMVTRGEQVALLENIVTRKTALESTCLVFGYGLDLVLSKSMPVGGFDVLNSDFNYGMLILTVIVMLIITEYTIRSVKEKELQDAWR